MRTGRPLVCQTRTHAVRNMRKPTPPMAGKTMAKEEWPMMALTPQTENAPMAKVTVNFKP